MCGLLGSLGVLPTSNFVDSQLDTLAHRGPDDRGMWSSPDGDVVLGQRRLSIIDLSASGHQPMVSHDGSVVLVNNGEIYNYRELRAELRGLGHQFRSDSDTEVLLTAYLQWGRECVHRLVGMWAFALYDGRTDELWLCRDPFGIKPLFLVETQHFVAFASEITPLLELVSGRHDAQVVYDYLRWGHVDRGTRTFLEGISRLGAGESLVVSRQHPASTTRSQWVTLPSRSATSDMSFTEAATELRRLLTHSVELHMRSDVAVGSALSGGVDSSTIVMLTRQIGGASLDLHTFSYLATGEAIDESPWVATVAAAANAHRHDVLIDSAELPGLVEGTSRAQFEPYGSLSIVAQHAVFRAARDAGVTVMLDGQGADELFAGYPSFRADRLVDLIRRGRWLAARRLAARVAAHDGRGAAARAVARAAPRPVAAGLWARWMRRSTPAWLDTDWFEQRGVQVAPDEADLPDSFEAAVEGSQHTNSLPSLLRYEDRNSMAWSIESRVPFLTLDLARFAASVPAEYLLDRNGTTKALLVAAMRGLVPDAVLDRHDKVAFSVPQQRWLGHLPGGEAPGDVGLRPGPLTELRPRVYANFVSRAAAGLSGRT